MHITTKIIVASAAAMAVVAGGAAAFAATGQPAPKVTVEQAIQAAQKEVPGAWVREAGFDGRGTQADAWEVELVKDTTEHEVLIDAGSGKVLEKHAEAAESDETDDDAPAATGNGQGQATPQEQDDADDANDADDD